MKKWWMILALAFVAPLQSLAAGGGNLQLEKANNDLTDKASLQRGAVLFSEYCMACHSVKYMRYNRIARDIGWSDEEIMKKMAFGQGRVVDDVLQHIPAEVEQEVFGTVAPDLSLMARLKGTDYIYTFLLAFEEKNGKWDNHILPGTAMPNVLEGLERHEKPEDVEQAARDIANFLEYVGEPAKLIRWDLGWKVLLYLAFLFLLTYLLKKEYWRDVK
jgi:ubiquinol-cytochrome c reductase cytochrome c1 subunit